MQNYTEESPRRNPEYERGSKMKNYDYSEPGCCTFTQRVADNLYGSNLIDANR